MDGVFVCCPVYDGRLDFGTSQRLWLASRKRKASVPQINPRSLLASNCNKLWCDALNARQPMNLKWFAMLHSDIEPEAYWVDRLLDEAETHGADLLSAVAPMKDARGLVSTAIDSPVEGFDQFCRLTLRQVNHPLFPVTFGIEEAAAALENLPEELQITNVPRTRLLVNTGCMVCRIDQPWAEKVWFEMRDGIELHQGQWRDRVVSEDWMFSKNVADQGGKVMATKALRLVHYGQAEFVSNQVWGQNRDALRMGP